MFHALTKIGQKHGLVGLWRGAVGGLPRVVIGSSTQLCTFSSTKDLLIQWEVLPGEGWDHPWTGEQGCKKGGGPWMGWGQGSKGRERQEGWGHRLLPEGVPNIKALWALLLQSYHTVSSRVVWKLLETVFPGQGLSYPKAE